MERDRLTRTQLELLDPAMSEAPITGMTCHLHEPMLVVFSSPEAKRVLTDKKEFETN